MEPLSLIATALIAGAASAAKGVAGQAVKDGYAGFKALLVRKFGNKADLEDALNGVEKRPESEARQGVLKEELATARADQDAELVQQAQVFLDLLRQEGFVSGPSYKATVIGDGAIAQGEGAVAAGAGGVAVGGDVQGSTIVTGEQKNVDTSGGAYVDGNVEIKDGDFVGRDKVIRGDQVDGDKI